MEPNTLKISRFLRLSSTFTTWIDEMQYTMEDLKALYGKHDVRRGFAPARRRIRVTPSTEGKRSYSRNINRTRKNELVFLFREWIQANYDYWGAEPDQLTVEPGTPSCPITQFFFYAYYQNRHVGLFPPEKPVYLQGNRPAWMNFFYSMALDLPPPARQVHKKCTGISKTWAEISIILDTWELSGEKWKQERLPKRQTEPVYVEYDPEQSLAAEYDRLAEEFVAARLSGINTFKRADTFDPQPGDPREDLFGDSEN